MSDPELRCFDSTQQLDSALAESVAGHLIRAIRKRDQAGLAVSGGRTPSGFFQTLSHTDMNWSKVKVTLVDERWVDTQSEDSNERLLREQLLQGQAQSTQIIGLKTAHDSPDAAKLTCQQRLQSLNWPLDVIHLGMGEDGHTASWFESAPEYSRAIDPENHDLVMAVHPATTPQARMTMTLHSVLNCRQLIVQITGEKKRRLLESALNWDQSHLPIAHILHQTRTPVTIFWAPS